MQLPQHKLIVQPNLTRFPIIRTLLFGPTMMLSSMPLLALLFFGFEYSIILYHHYGYREFFYMVVFLSWNHVACCLVVHFYAKKSRRNFA